MIDEAWAGSSPLARGKPCVRYAGCRCSRAHPRSCGENVRTPCAFSLPYGSSPLTRGKHHIPDCDVMTLGLIPAHAGKTKSPGGCQGCGWAHPHSCGENAKARGYRTMCMGSSPLARGKQAASRGCCVAARIIPAHARKTPSSSPPGVKARAHPRSRGENQATLYAPPDAQGSSPLTRGKRVRCRAEREPPGLIPAHAGKTRGYASLPGLSRAHPRSRGENIRPRLVVWENVGSSPLTRGKPSSSPALMLRLGLIPAHAGKTTTAPSPRYPTWAHPRSRGENPGSGVWDEGGAGSSPLTRGKLFGPMAAST